MNDSAEDFDEEDAAAAMTCLISLTPRVVGSMRRSLVKVRAMPPVAVSSLALRCCQLELLKPTHDAPAYSSRSRHCIIIELLC